MLRHAGRRTLRGAHCAAALRPHVTAAEAAALELPHAQEAVPPAYGAGTHARQPRWLAELGVVRNDWTCVALAPRSAELAREGDCHACCQPRRTAPTTRQLRGRSDALWCRNHGVTHTRRLGGRSGGVPAVLFPLPPVDKKSETCSTRPSWSWCLPRRVCTGCITTPDRRVAHQNSRCPAREARHRASSRERDVRSSELQGAGWRASRASWTCA